MSRILMRITLAAALLCAHAAAATTLVALDLKALTQQSERVVLATVETVESFWSNDHTVIYTDVKVRVTRSYKGAAKPGEIMMVRREGGTVGEVTMRVFGAPVFSPGEEVVMFTEWRGAARYVVGMAQGKMRVLTTVDGKKQVAAPDLREVQVLPGARHPEVKVRSLDELESQIRIFTKQAPEGAR